MVLSLADPLANDEFQPTWAKPQLEKIREYDPNVERWRTALEQTMPPELRRRQDAAQLLDKGLWTMTPESGGNEKAVGDGGAAYGLYQSHHIPPGSDVTTQLNDFWRMVSANPKQWTDWGENNLYEGKIFGGLGNYPYNPDPKAPPPLATGYTPTKTNLSTYTPSSGESTTGSLIGHDLAHPDDRASILDKLTAARVDREVKSRALLGGYDSVISPPSVGGGGLADETGIAGGAGVGTMFGNKPGAAEIKAKAKMDSRSFLDKLVPGVDDLATSLTPKFLRQPLADTRAEGVPNDIPYGGTAFLEKYAAKPAGDVGAIIAGGPNALARQVGINDVGMENPGAENIGRTLAEGSVPTTAIGIGTLPLQALGAKGPVEGLTGLPVDSAVMGAARGLRRAGITGIKDAAIGALASSDRGAYAAAVATRGAAMYSDAAEAAARQATDILGNAATGRGGVQRALLGHGAADERFGARVRSAVVDKMGPDRAGVIENNLVRDGKTWAEFGDAQRAFDPETPAWERRPADAAAMSGPTPINPSDPESIKAAMRQAVAEVHAARAGEGTADALRQANENVRPSIGGENAMLPRESAQPRQPRVTPAEATGAAPERPTTQWRINNAEGNSYDVTTKAGPVSSSTEEARARLERNTLANRKLNAQAAIDRRVGAAQQANEGVAALRAGPLDPTAVRPVERVPAMSPRGARTDSNRLWADPEGKLFEVPNGQPHTSAVKGEGGLREAFQQGWTRVGLDRGPGRELYLSVEGASQQAVEQATRATLQGLDPERRNLTKVVAEVTDPTDLSKHTLVDKYVPANDWLKSHGYGPRPAIGGEGSVIARGGRPQRVSHVPDWAAGKEVKAVVQDGAEVLKGAPPGIETPADLAKLQQHVEDMAREGEGGRFWHVEGGHTMLDAAHGDVPTATKLAWIAAMGSPQTEVQSQGSQILKAWGQFLNHEPIAVHTGTQNARMNKILELSDDKFDQYVVDLLKEPVPDSRRKAMKLAGEEVDRGRKTANFFLDHLDIIDPERAAKIREMSGRSGITVDMHMMRAFGFTKDNPTEDEYSFVENVTKELANKLGWDNREAQAAIFTSDIIRDPTRKLSVEEAAQSYKQALENNRAIITWESAPGKGTEASAKLPTYEHWPLAQQVEFHSDVQRVFLDDNGNNILAKALGILGGAPHENVGFYEGEFHLGVATDVFMHPNTSQKVDELAALTGYVSQQTAVPWTRPVYDTRVGVQNGFVLDLGRSITPDEQIALQRNLGDNFVVAKGPGNDVYAFKVPGEKDFAGRSVGVNDPIYKELLAENKAARQQILDTIDEVWDPALEVRHSPMATEGNYLENDWTVAPNGEAYLAAAPSAQSPDVRETLSALRARYKAVVERHAAEHAADVLPGARDAAFDYSFLEPVSGLVARQRDITRTRGAAWIDPEGQIWLNKAPEHVDAIIGGREKGTMNAFQDVMDKGWVRVTSNKPDPTLGATRQITIEARGDEHAIAAADTILKSLPESARETTELLIQPSAKQDEFFWGNAQDWLDAGKPVRGSSGPPIPGQKPQLTDPFGRSLQTPGLGVAPDRPFPPGSSLGGPVQPGPFDRLTGGAVPNEARDFQFADPFHPTEAELQRWEEVSGNQLLAEANRLDQTGVTPKAGDTIADLATLAKRLGDPGGELRRQLQQNGILPGAQEGNPERRQQRVAQAPLGDILEQAPKAAGEPPANHWQVLAREARGVAGLPRTIMTAADVGAIFRNIPILGARMPREWANASKETVLSFKSEGAAQAAKAAVESSPLFSTATERAGLKLWSWGEGIQSTERLPGYEGLNDSVVSKWVEKAPWIKGSERAMATAQNVMGMKTFEKWAQPILDMEKAGTLTTPQATKRLEDLASVINHSRGYSGSKVAEVTGALNFFFSAQFTASRFQVVADPLVMMFRGSPEARNLAAQSLLSFAGSNALMLGTLGALGSQTGLWSVNVDPRSSDFGQLKVGNTRYDSLAGLGPLIKVLARTGAVATDAATGGRTNLALDQRTIGDLVKSYFENKAQPVAKVVTDFIEQNKLPKATDIPAMFAPMLATGIIETLQNERSTPLGIANAAAGAAASAVGLGANTYANANDVMEQKSHEILNKPLDQASPLERVKLLDSLPEDVQKSGRKAEKATYDELLAGSGYKAPPKDKDGNPAPEDEDTQKARVAKNLEVMTQNPELDVQRWYWGGKNTSALNSKAAVDKALELGIKDRKVSYQGTTRNLAASDADKAAWKAYGHVLQAVDDAQVNHDNLQAFAQFMYQKKLGDLKPAELSNVRSRIGEEANKDPKIAALQVFFGARSPNASGEITVTGSVYSELQKLWKEFPKAAQTPKKAKILVKG